MNRIIYPPNHIVLFTLFLILTASSYSQVGIGNISPHESSLLDIHNSAGDKGVLIPRVNIPNLSSQNPIVGAAAESLLVYNTNTETGKGFYYWSTDSSSWQTISGESANADIDWYVTQSTNSPEHIDDDIYTNGKVGIGIDRPYGALHIFEETGSPASFSGGSLTIEHGNEGGESSIVFRSAVNPNSDVGYIKYQDDGSENGSTTENSLLEIGIENDGPANAPPYVDDINIESSGSVGISNRSPNASASLDLGHTNRGLLVNRVALTAANNAAPVNNPVLGLLVFNTNTNFTPNGYINDVRPGFYYWNGKRWISQTPENRSARFHSSNKDANLNQNKINEVAIFASQDWNDDTVLYKVNSSHNTNDLILGEDGRYEIVVNIPIFSNSTLVNIDAQVLITRSGNHISPGAYSSNNVISAQSGHNYSTIQIHEIIELQAGDHVSIDVSREANSGKVTISDTGDGNFTITKIK